MRVKDMADGRVHFSTHPQNGIHIFLSFDTDLPILLAPHQGEPEWEVSGVQKGV